VPPAVVSLPVDEDVPSVVELVPPAEVPPMLVLASVVALFVPPTPALVDVPLLEAPPVVVVAPLLLLAGVPLVTGPLVVFDVTLLVPTEPVPGFSSLPQASATTSADPME